MFNCLYVEKMIMIKILKFLCWNRKTFIFFYCFNDYLSESLNSYWVIKKQKVSLIGWIIHRRETNWNEEKKNELKFILYVETNIAIFY